MSPRFGMNPFGRKAFVRMATVSAAVALLAAGPVWWVSREQAEAQVVAFAQEESRRILQANQGQANGALAEAAARHAAQALVGGLFEIAELYDRSGQKLAEAHTPLGATLEAQLPKHQRPSVSRADYESIHLPDGRWVMRVLAPLVPQAGGTAGDWGYFEGVRVLTPWQRAHMNSDALVAALMAMLASLACGVALYPVVMYLARDNERKARLVLESHVAMMEALGRAIAKRDSDTGAHNYRVAWMAAQLGEAMGLRGSDMQALIAGSFLHDVGKIGIPDAILLKPGRLDAQEMAVMRTHVAQGEEIVRGAGWLQGAAEVVSCHHERWDGTGYPKGLRGEAIPLAARIFAVVDVFDALSSRRPYKEPLPFDRVMAMLKEGEGTHFDPRVLACFVTLAPSLCDALQGLGEDGARRLMTQMIERHFDVLAPQGASAHGIGRG